MADEEKVEEGSRIFNVMYHARCGMFTEEELEKKNYGGCDSLLIVPIIKKEPDKVETNKTFLLGGMDGFTKEELTDQEVFEVMMFLAGTLVKSVTLKPWQIDMCAAIQKAVRGLFGYSGERKINGGEDD